MTTTIKTSDHNNEVGCVYITHIYAYDAAGNYCTEAISINVPTPATPAPPTPTPAPPTEAPPTEAPPTEVPPTEAPWDDPTDEQPVPITSDLVEVMPIKPQVYTGGIIEPEPVVLYTGAILTKDFDYTVTYYNNIKIGKATVIIKGIGYFTGMVKKTFKIIPKSVKLTKLSSVNGRLTAVWGRRKSVSGYQLEYSQKRSFSSSTRVTVSGAKTGKKTIKGLKAKKAYYVRIRTYKKVGGKKYYSKWSSAKKIKIK